MLNLKELRQLQNLTGQEVADALGIERSLYVRYENGTRMPPLDNLVRIADFFGVTLGCVAGTEPIPQGYPVSYFHPARASELKRPQPKSEKKKKLPFSEAQIAYLEEREDRLVEKITEALKEDTSSSSGA